jgi:L-methionine (R)-S-oxide reductase
MAESISVIGTTKEEKYQSLIPQIKHLVEGEPDKMANIANIIAALKFSMNFFWVGIYFVKNNIANTKEELVLGPFQGPVACTRIAYGKGVCGKAWEQAETIIVDDVDLFPGHIACSSLSKSEIVIPIVNSNKEITMVLDIDSEQIANFDTVDNYYLNKIVEIIAKL